VRAAPEKFQRHFLVRLLQHNYQAARYILSQQIRNRVCRAGRQRRFENQDVSGEFLHGRYGLSHRFGLAHDANIIFKREDFAQAGAKDSLAVREYYADRALAIIGL
jgi:hypothetical protein